MLKVQESTILEINICVKFVSVKMCFFPDEIFTYIFLFLNKKGSLLLGLW